jgi:Transglycosylase SLT domain
MPPASSPPTVDGDEADDSNRTRAATRRRRWVRPLGAAVLAATLACGAAGCLAPAPSGPSPAVDAAIHAAFDSAGALAVVCMTEVAGRESHWDPGAQNASGASGLFQIMLPLHDDLFSALGVSPAAWNDPYWNAQAARELWNSSGIAPWGSC